MKKLLLAALLLCPGWGVFAQSVADSNVAVLAYSADQLAAKFAGKTRKEIVAAINTVPAAENVFTAPDGTEYELLRYGGAHQDYRMFLFSFRLPQTLLGVADSPQGVMAFNQKYQLNIPVTQQQLAKYATPALVSTVEDVANNTQYQVYQNGDEFLLFQNGTLTRRFDNAQQYAAFMATITASNSSYAAAQAQQQTALEQARLAQQTTPVYVERRSYVGPILGTALVGGLIWSTAHHWHRHHHPGPVFAPVRPVVHHARPGGPGPGRPGGHSPRRR